MNPSKSEKNKPKAAPAKGEEPPQSLDEQVIDVLRTVYDPEIPVNIYELGLVYGIDIQPGGDVLIRMTLTSPGCPVAASLPIEVESKLRDIPDVTSARVEIVWDPPWNPDMISEAGKLQLGLF
jgi:FeS assembly SUF system protein